MSCLWVTMVLSLCLILLIETISLLGRSNARVGDWKFESLLCFLTLETTRSSTSQRT